MTEWRGHTQTSGLSTQTKSVTNVLPGDLWYDTDTGIQWEFNGTSWIVNTINAQRVTISGPVGLSHNRRLGSAAATYSSTTNTATYAAGAQPTALSVSAEAPTTDTNIAGTLLAIVVINAPNDATASAWLSDAGTSTTDVQYWPVYKGIPTEITSDTPISRVDCLMIVAMPLYLGGN